MAKYSKETLQKLNTHFIKFKKTVNGYEENCKELKLKQHRHSKIFIKNKDLIKNLLIELIFLKIQLLELTKRKTSFDRKILLENKSFFIDDNLYDKTYLSYNNEYLVTKKAKSLIRIIFNELKQLKLLIRESLYSAKNKTKDLYKNNKKINLLKKAFFTIIKKIELYLAFITNELMKRWYVYITRFLIITLIHFVPFIQLTSTLFYNLPNRNVAHPISSYLFHLAPFLVPTIRLTAPLINQENFSFLILVPYMHLFAFSFKKYKIPRKIAYQGTFALVLQLFRYSIILCQDTTSVLYKFTKRFFFIKKYQGLNLLQEDMNFYLEDLEESRLYREEILQLGESIFSVNVLPTVTKLYEPTTILSFLAVIALLYNYMYFIFSGQKPIIPGVTRIVRRMMVDRNSQES